MRWPALALAALALASPASARTWYVTPDGTGDAPTIQAAVQLASDGDVVELADGTFLGNGNRDVDFLGKNIIIRSDSDDPTLCVIDVQGSPGENHRGFILQNGEGPDVGLRSLTITGGYMVGTTPPVLRGGAVCASFGVQAFFENVRFESNTAADAGAVCIGSGGQSRFEDCSFLDNRAVEAEAAGYGGSVFLMGATGTFSNCRFVGNESHRIGGALLVSGGVPVILTDCDFEDNVSVESFGGAVLASGPAVITNCRFRRNEARGLHEHGGALAAHELEMTGCTFTENIADWGGGAVVVWNEPATISDCEFISNMARRAGALYLSGSVEATVRGCRFEGNTATGTGSTDGGGAIHLSLSASGELLQNSFVGNSAAFQGGAVFHSGVSFTMESCTLVGNAAPLGGGIYFYRQGVVERTVIAFGAEGAAVACGEIPSFGCSDIYGNAGGDWAGSCIASQADTNGNFSANPLFCNADAGDFHLQWGSPCLPANSNGCGLIGRYGFGGCNSISVTPETWGKVKARFRSVTKDEE